MSIYDKASLVLIPSGTKTSKIYSQKPTNGDGDFTFSRSTAATRVNASGNIEKETQNLLLQSNTFNTTWYDSGTALTSGYAGYDGLTDAWEASRGGAFNYVAQDITTSGVQSYSIYAKAGSFDFLLMRFQRSSLSYAGAYFDLASGAVGTIDSGIVDTKIEAAGNGYYRCTLVFNESLNRVLFYPVPSNGGVGAGGSGTIYIQDAQLEQGLVARDVITTTTTAIYGGITDNVPRLDYTDSSCPALLLEPQRTNLVTQSEYIGSWGTLNASVVDNATTSPEGVTNAAALVDNATSGSHYVQSDVITHATGEDMMASVFLKKGTRTQARVRLSGGTGTAYFNLEDGSVVSESGATATIEDYGNGWYRCAIFDDSAQFGTGRLQVMSAVNGNSSYVGDGTEAIYIYGAQYEHNVSYTTSYIPTYGSAVTRNQDNTLNSSAASVIGQTEGAIYAEVDFKAISEESRFVQLSDGTNNNRFLVGSTSSNGVQIYVVSGGAVQWTPATTAFSDGVIKVAVAYKNNDYAMYVNGTQINTSSSASVPAMDEISIGYNSIVGNRPTAYGHRKVMLFPTRLTNAELADLTTL